MCVCVLEIIFLINPNETIIKMKRRRNKEKTENEMRKSF